MQSRELFSNAFVSHSSLPARLTEGIRDAWSEFKKDPAVYVRDLLRKDPISRRRRTGLRLGLALALALYCIFGFAVLILWTGAGSSVGLPVQDIFVRDLFNPAIRPPTPDLPKKGKDGKDGDGGGGGGKDQLLQPSNGNPPPFALTNPIIAPTTKPQLVPPALAVALTLQVDPKIQPPRDDSPIGLPNAVVGPPADGPGQDGGVGTGKGGGIGNGGGKGFLDGRDKGTGGGYPGGGRETVSRFDRAPIPLNRPHPNYTEEARRTKVQGIVRARVLVGSDGFVKQVNVIQGLPGGLNEEAIRAAYMMRFSPATKSGRPVAAWVALEIEFNLR